MRQNEYGRQRLIRRIAAYTSSAGAILGLGSGEMHAQIEYSGLQNLDVGLDTAYVELDLDGDMTNDFAFSFDSMENLSTYNSFVIRYISRFAAIQNIRTDSYRNSWITTLTTLRSSTSEGSVTYVYRAPVVKKLDEGFLIHGDTLSWNYASYLYFSALLGMSYTFTIQGPLFTISYSGFKGHFSGEGIIGVRFFIGSDQHYGWIRVQVEENMESMRIVDWAWETTPGNDIVAGRESDNMEIFIPGYPDRSAGRIRLFPNPADEILNVIMEEASIVQLADTKGRILYTGEKTRMESIPVSGYPEGLYFVRIKHSGGITVTKIIIQ